MRALATFLAFVGIFVLLKLAITLGISEAVWDKVVIVGTVAIVALIAFHIRKALKGDLVIGICLIAPPILQIISYIVR